MKKYLPIAAALVLALAGCGNSAPQQAEDTSTAPEAVEEEVVEEEGEDESADQGLIIDWTTAATAEEAAKGAGFDKFGVIDKFTLGDLEFKDPTFAYAGGVAQATYETPATAVFVRKGVETYETPLSDRNLDEFDARWHKVITGVDITCYGPAKGAVTVATWTDGTKSYGLTFQGLGGEEMTMDVDELESLVKGFNEANADQKEATKTEEEKKEETKTEEKKQESSSSSSNSSSSSSSQQSSLLSAAEAEALAQKTCQGNCISIDRVVTKQYGECWYAVCVDDGGNRFEYYINNSGIYLIDEKGAQKENTTPAKTDGHYEGEPVTIYGSVYAEWHQINGTWMATFITYNNTQIFAQQAQAGGGWVFYAYRNGKQVQVIYSDQESSVSGEYGPAGVSSHWCNIDNYHDWY